MWVRGHLGLGLIIFFLLFSFFRVTDIQYLETAFLALALVTLPDIDLRLEIAHRKYTHNILFAIIMGIAFGFALESFSFWIGFIAGFSAIIIHILGDILTYMPFAPLWPFYKKKVSLKLFRSSNRYANNFFLDSGLITLIYYLIFVYSNVGYTLIKELLSLMQMLSGSYILP